MNKHNRCQVCGIRAELQKHKVGGEYVLVCRMCQKKEIHRCKKCRKPMAKRPKSKDSRAQDVYPDLHLYCSNCDDSYKESQRERHAFKYCKMCGYEHLQDGPLCRHCAIEFAVCKEDGCGRMYYRSEGKEAYKVQIMGSKGRSKHILIEGRCEYCAKATLNQCDCGRHYEGDASCCSLCKSKPRVKCHECGKDVVQGKGCSVRSPEQEKVYLCRACYDTNAAGECGGCGKAAYPLGSRYHQHHDNSRRCPACADGIPIMRYNYHRVPKFFGEGPLFFGVENEYDFKVDSYKKHTNTLRKWVLEHRDMYHLTHDGSLLYGAEIVSQPCSYEKWMEMETILPPVPNVLNNRSKKTGEIGTAACHIHISRSAFGKFHLYKFITFLNDNFERLLPVFGRGIGDYCRDIEGDIGSFVRRAKRQIGRYQEKYRWISLAPKHTVEVRVFRAASSDEELRGYLQILMSAYEFTKTRGSKKLVWDEYVELLRHKYPHALNQLSADTSANEPPVCPKYSRSRGEKRKNPRIPDRARKKIDMWGIDPAAFINPNIREEL